jgi:hypothetical protein
VPSSSGSLVTTIKPEIKYRFFEGGGGGVESMILFCVVQKCDLKIVYFLSIVVTANFDSMLNGAGIHTATIYYFQ